MQQTISKYDYNRARCTTLPRSITPEKSKVVIEPVNQEVLKVEQIFSKVNEVFAQRQHTNKLLANEVRDNECQLQFLEKQIREQIESNAFQNASLALSSHNLGRLTTEVSNYVNIDFETVSKGFQTIQDSMNESESIVSTLFRELGELAEIEKFATEELNDLRKQLSDIMSELQHKEKKEEEYSFELSSLEQEENECEHKIQESDIQLRTAGEQLADATLALKKAEGDMNSMQQKLDCETAALAQRSLENGPTGAALELVTKIGEFSKRRECLAKAVAAFKDAMKTSEAAMVHLDALSATLRSKIKTSMLTTESNSREVKSLCAKWEALQKKRSAVRAKIEGLEGEIAVECDTIAAFEKDKKDLENVVTENAREIERCYDVACQRMKELKDLNEERPRLLQLLNTAQCASKSKLDKLREEVALALAEQRLLQEKQDSHRTRIAAKESMLEIEQTCHQIGRNQLNLVECSANSLQADLQSLASEKRLMGDTISLLERKVAAVEEYDDQVRELDSLLAKNETKKESVVDEINRTRAALISCRSAPPTASELPERIIEAVNVEIDCEWMPTIAEMTAFHVKDIQEMQSMLRQLEAGFPNNDDSDLQYCNANLMNEIESATEEMKKLATAIIDAENHNAVREVERQKRLREEELLRLQRLKEEEELRLQRLKEEEEQRLQRIKEEEELQRLKEERRKRLKEEEELKTQQLKAEEQRLRLLEEERQQRLKEEEELKLQQMKKEELRLKHLEEEKQRRLKEEEELKVQQMKKEELRLWRIQEEAEINKPEMQPEFVQKSMNDASIERHTSSRQGKSTNTMNQRSQQQTQVDLVEELTPGSDSIQLSFIDEESDTPAPTNNRSNTSHKRPLLEQNSTSIKSAPRHESPVLQGNRMRVAEASKESLRAEYHKRTLKTQQSLPSRKDLSAIRKGASVQRDSKAETAKSTQLANQTGAHNDDDVASVYTMSNLFGDSMFAEKISIPNSLYASKTQSTAVSNTISQENETALRRKYARTNSENQRQNSDFQKADNSNISAQRSTYSSMPTKTSQPQQKQIKKDSRSIVNHSLPQSTRPSQKLQHPFHSQTLAAATQNNRPATETPKPRSVFLSSGAYQSAALVKNDAAKKPAKSSPGDWFLEEDDAFR